MHDKVVIWASQQPWSMAPFILRTTCWCALGRHAELPRCSFFRVRPAFPSDSEVDLHDVANLCMSRVVGKAWSRLAGTIHSEGRHAGSHAADRHDDIQCTPGHHVAIAVPHVDKWERMLPRWALRIDGTLSRWLTKVPRFA